MTAQQAPQPLTVPEPLEVLAALGAPATVPAHLDDADAVLHLSHGLVGAAERKAMEADLAVRANGADVTLSSSVVGGRRVMIATFSPRVGLGSPGSPSVCRTDVELPRRPSPWRPGLWRTCQGRRTAGQETSTE
jgi:hypothetical protein